MKRSPIHRGFCREMLRQLRTKGLVSTCILAGINLITFAVFATRDPLNSTVAHVDPRLMALPMLAFLYVMCPVMVFGAYRWLNKRAESDFYHAIPLSRTQLYVSASLAIFTWLAIALTGYAAVQALLYAVFGLPFNYLLFLCVFLNMLIAAIGIVAAFSLGSALSGTRFVAFFSSLILLFLPRALLIAFRILVEVDSGVTTPFSALPFFLNPAFNIAATPIHSIVYGADFANGWAMLYSLAYACGLFLLGGIAFRRRRSESADIPYTSKTLQTITRVTFGLPPLALIVVFLNLCVRYGYGDFVISGASVLPLTVASVFFSFLFYCLYELISSRKIKAVVKAMPYYGIVLGAALLLIFVPASIGRLIRPAAVSADRVRSVRFSGESTLIMPYGADGAERYPEYLLHAYTFRDENSKAQAALWTRGDEIQSYEMIRFNRHAMLIDDGGLLQKVAYLTNDWSVVYDSIVYTDLALKDPAYAERFYAFPEGRIRYQCAGLTMQEASEVGRLFKEDYEKLTNEQKLSLMPAFEDLYSNSYQFCPVDLRIDLYGCKGTNNFTMSYRVNEQTPNAAKYYLSILNERSGAKVKQTLKRCVAQMETRNAPHLQTFLQFCGMQISVDGWYDEQNGDALPKDRNPKLYAILKALSEAPLSTDAANCLTIETEEYDFYSGLLVHPPVGIACPPELLNEIRSYWSEYCAR